MALAARLRTASALLLLVASSPLAAASPATGTFSFEWLTFDGLAVVEARESRLALGVGEEGGRDVVLGRADLVRLADGRTVRGAVLTLHAAEPRAAALRSATGIVVEGADGHLGTSGDGLVLRVDEPRRAATNGHALLTLFGGGSLRIAGDRTILVQGRDGARAPLLELDGAAVDVPLPEGWRAELASSAMDLGLDGVLRLHRASGEWQGRGIGGTFERSGALRLRLEHVEVAAAGEAAPWPAQSDPYGVALGTLGLPTPSAPRSLASAAQRDGGISGTLSDVEPGAARVEPAPAVRPAQVAFAALVGLAFLLAVKKSKVLAFVVSLGSRISGDMAKRHPARERILALLREHPGMRLAELERATGMMRNTVEYHLALLRRCGLIESQARYGSTRWFLRGGIAVGEVQLAQAVLRRQRLSSEILRAVEERPGVTVTEVADRLAMHPSHTMYHLRKLFAARLVDARKEGRTRRLYPFGQAFAAPMGSPAGATPSSAGG